MILDGKLAHIECTAWMSSNATSRFSALRSVIFNLATVHESYIAAESEGGQIDDCTFWYKERPQIGLLAAAVWKSGGIALEEYGVQKKRESDQARGRGDLYLKVGRERFECEAKYVWLGCGKGANYEEKFEKSLDAAIKDSKRINGEQSIIAVCFGTVAIRSDSGHAVEGFSQIAKKLKVVTHRQKGSTAFVVMSPVGRSVKGSEGEKCLGLVVAFCEVVNEQSLRVRQAKAHTRP